MIHGMRNIYDFCSQHTKLAKSWCKHLHRIVDDEGVCQLSPQRRQVLEVVALHKDAAVPEDAVPDEPPAAKACHVTVGVNVLTGESTQSG